MKFSAWLRTFVEDFKAWRRGEKRVAPRGARGRVYARKSGEESSPNNRMIVAKRPTATLEIKVTRADGTVEHRTVPAEVIQVDDRE